MFKFLKQDNQAIMGLTLTQLGIIIAAAMILAALSNILFDSTWQEKQKMRQIAEEFSSSFVSIDAAWYETKKPIPVSKKFQGYNIMLSSSTIEVSTAESSNHFIRKPLIVHPLIRTCSDDWVTAEQLHNYLYQHYGHQGTKTDPIPENSDVHAYLTTVTNNTSLRYSLQPYIIDKMMQITLEKVLIYVDENLNGTWEETEHILDPVLLYQCNR